MTEAMDPVRIHTIGTYREAEAYLLNAPRFTSKHTIAQTRDFLKVLGSPDRNLRIVHVAGTNGKGSVCAYLDSILREAGYSVGLFTSPHLVRMTERIAVDGEQISEEDFLRCFRAVAARLPGLPDSIAPLPAGKGDLPADYHPTFFEYLFFLAMIYFAEKAPDFVLLETGLGGRLDATNAVSGKTLAVITRIGFDHTQILGETLQEIAAEKAGILQPGVPVVYDDFVPEASEVIRRTAEERGCPAFPAGEDRISEIFRNNPKKNIDFSLCTRYYGIIRVSLSTIARYQTENVSVAVRAAEELAPLSPEVILAGIRRMRWAGRMEERFPGVWLDGAHNVDGIRAFLETVGEDGCAKEDRQLLFGVVRDKDFARMAEEVAASELFRRIVVVRPATERAADPEAVAEIFRAHPGCVWENGGSAAKALSRLQKEKGRGRIYVAGSLYLIGELVGEREDDQF